jgi:hypothetical protein
MLTNFFIGFVWNKLHDIIYCRAEGKAPVLPVQVEKLSIADAKHVSGE